MSIDHPAPSLRFKRPYRGLFGANARRRCPHQRLDGIYGDEIRFVGWYRLQCLDCGRYLDGPVRLAQTRQADGFASGWHEALSEMRARLGLYERKMRTIGPDELGRVDRSAYAVPSDTWQELVRELMGQHPKQ